MESSRFLELLEADAARVASVARRGLEAPVPSCPGWTVDSVVTHVGFVYLHKIVCMRTLANPDPWPPDDLPDLAPLDRLTDATKTLLDELRTRGPDAPSFTWWPPDQSVGFWYRRMAQETAVHRIDVEQAHDCVTPVDPELAADGVDEALLVMLAGDWSDSPVEDAAGKVAVLSTGDRSWRVELEPGEVRCVEVTASDPSDRSARSVGPDATVTGDPHDLLLWVWGRAGLDDGSLSVDGDRAVIEAVRGRLAVATL